MEGDDIESAIHAEVANIKQPTQAALFTPIMLDVQCGMSHGYK